MEITNSPTPNSLCCLELMEALGEFALKEVKKGENSPFKIIIQSIEYQKIKQY